MDDLERAYITITELRAKVKDDECTIKMLNRMNDEIVQKLKKEISCLNAIINGEDFCVGGRVLTANEREVWFYQVGKRVKEKS